MDPLWDLEDKLKLSTQGAILVFVCIAFSVVGLCTIVLKKKKKKRLQGKKRALYEEEAINTNRAEVSCSWGSIKKVLMGSLRWSEASKVELEEMQALNWQGDTPALLVGGRKEAEIGWQSHNSESPVWQRPILMGEKCELPMFSGLILYDERGHPLHQIQYQEKPKAAATLKDLL